MFCWYLKGTGIDLNVPIQRIDSQKIRKLQKQHPTETAEIMKQDWREAIPKLFAFVSNWELQAADTGYHRKTYLYYQTDGSCGPRNLASDERKEFARTKVPDLIVSAIMALTDMTEEEIRPLIEVDMCHQGVG